MVRRYVVPGLAVVVAALSLAAAALAATGDLTQKAGTAGCYSDDGSGGACADGRHLVDVRSLVVSPDGKNVYAAGGGVNSIDVFDRDPATGAIIQKPGTAGCIQGGGADIGCNNGGFGIANVIDIAISPDGRNVYAVATSPSAVTIFDRDPATGVLTQKNPGGCIAQGGVGLCTAGVALASAAGVVVSPDGKNVYVAAASSGAVASFNRDATTGALTQKPDPAACISETGSGGVCVDGRGLTSAAGIEMSPDGASLYVTGADGGSGNLAVLHRDTGTGVLSQTNSAVACFTESGNGGDCTVAAPVDGAFETSVSPDGKNVYLASGLGVGDGGGVVVFDRDTGTGNITQKTGPAGCFTDDGNGGCTDATGLLTPFGIEVSGDGGSVYVSTRDSGSVATFDRNPANGTLAQKPGTAGCVSSSGAGGLCAVGRALGIVRSVAISPDGSSVYAPSDAGIAVFDRDDGVAPDTSVTSGPSGDTTEASPSFAFTATEPGAAFECSLDSGAFAACTSPQAYSALALGAHTFAVRATDRTGNADATPAQRAFTVIAGSPPPPADTKVDGTVSAKPKQKQKPGKVTVVVTIRAREALSVNASGTVKLGKRKFALAPKTTKVASGKTLTLTLKPKKQKDTKTIAAALKKGGKAKAAVTVRLTDASGNSAQKLASLTVTGTPGGNGTR